MTDQTDMAGAEYRKSAEPTSRRITGTRPIQIVSHRRSKAWVYYTILAILSFVVTVTSSLAGLVGVALCGAYVIYPYRGGRVVVWFW